MEFTERQFTAGEKLAVVVWLLQDKTTQAVRVKASEYDLWRQTPGQPPDLAPGKPVNGAIFLVATSDHLPLDTVDGWPHAGDTWIEGDRRIYQVSEDLDWHYAYVRRTPISETNAIQIKESWRAYGNRSVDPNSIPGFEHLYDEAEVTIHHSVGFLFAASGESSGSAQIASLSLDCGSSSNRAVAVGLCIGDVATVSGQAATVGGQSAASQVAITTGINGKSTAEIFGRITTLTGAQTVEVTWVTNNYAGIGAISADGVNQTTPFNNPITADGNGGTAPLEVTSTSGDLTMTVVNDISGLDILSTDANEAWRFRSNSFFIGCGGDYGDGAGTQTHTWTLDGNHNYAIAGINFVQASGVTALEVEAFN